MWEEKWDFKSGLNGGDNILCSQKVCTQVVINGKPKDMVHI